MAGQRPSKQIGALWTHTAKNDQTGVFLSGNLELGALGEIPIVVFKNHRKSKPIQPDYRIVLSAERGEAPPTEEVNDHGGQMGGL